MFMTALSLKIFRSYDHLIPISRHWLSMSTAPNYIIPFIMFVRDEIVSLEKRVSFLLAIILCMLGLSLLRLIT